jgi:hypothetical protein
MCRPLRYRHPESIHEALGLHACPVASKGPELTLDSDPVLNSPRGGAIPEIPNYNPIWCNRLEAAVLYVSGPTRCIDLYIPEFAVH